MLQSPAAPGPPPLSSHVLSLYVGPDCEVAVGCQCKMLQPPPSFLVPLAILRCFRLRARCLHQLQTAAAPLSFTSHRCAVSNCEPAVSMISSRSYWHSSDCSSPPNSHFLSPSLLRSRLSGGCHCSDSCSSPCVFHFPSLRCSKL